MKDGHVHTPFCPHGTEDPISAYVERALELGYSEITFAEHAPLPKGFTDPTPSMDSAMRLEDLEGYFAALEEVKRSYKGRIKINLGLEVDFIEGFESETKAFLDEYGRHLDDSILSVHFLKLPNGRYDCLDYSPGTFGAMLEQYGSVKNLHLHYYLTVLKSVQSDLGTSKPGRIGHITLANKFQLKYPLKESLGEEVSEILTEIARREYELDYNGAGTAKPLCREPYPPDWIAGKAKLLGIQLVYGSDAHQVKELGQGLDRMQIRKKHEEA